MKPYFRVVYNMIRFKWIALFECDNLAAKGVPLFGFNTKICVKKSSEVSFGSNIVSDGRMVIIVDADGKLEIGKKTYFNEGMMISCKNTVRIGENCRFGPSVKLFDNDHCFDAATGVSDAHVSAPITIGNNCWIGANVVILKGTMIGDNCVIGAGCIVKGDIPSGSLVSQNRELQIRSIG